MEPKKKSMGKTRTSQIKNRNDFLPDVKEK